MTAIAVAKEAEAAAHDETKLKIGVGETENETDGITAQGQGQETGGVTDALIHALPTTDVTPVPVRAQGIEGRNEEGEGRGQSRRAVVTLKTHGDDGERTRRVEGKKVVREGRSGRKRRKRRRKRYSAGRDIFHHPLTHSFQKKSSSAHWGKYGIITDVE